ncbi:N-acyl homoserine lactonase family protein [Roseibium algicola]|nr:N-acyl homoserine lactonase family protein [Roseibium aggregatum]
MNSNFLNMKWCLSMPMLVVAGVALTTDAPHAAQNEQGTVENLTVFECGQITGVDRSFWSPGVDVGVAHEMVASCYLIRHSKGLMVWDTGIPAAVANIEEGLQIADGKINLTVEQPFPEQLRSFGVDPGNVDFLAMSHMHADHAGNANIFSNATWFIQQAEYDAAFGTHAAEFNFNAKTYDQLDPAKAEKLTGYHDVFGDRSVIIIPAPGHTPGHQVLWVNLKSGPVVLSGDLWHFESNHEHQRVPGFNFDREQTLSSMRMIDGLIAATGARLFIQHDKNLNVKIPHAPYSIQ